MIRSNTFVIKTAIKLGEARKPHPQYKGRCILPNGWCSPSTEVHSSSKTSVFCDFRSWVRYTLPVCIRPIRRLWYNKNWVVVLKIFYFHPENGEEIHPFWQNIFQKGLVQPPTRECMILEMWPGLTVPPWHDANDAPWWAVSRGHFWRRLFQPSMVDLNGLSFLAMHKARHPVLLVDHPVGYVLHIYI